MKTLTISVPQILETELRKLQASVQETTQTFDEILNRLFEKKVKSEMVLYQVSLRHPIFQLTFPAKNSLNVPSEILQEELKVTNLLYSLLLDEELSTREAGLNHYLEKKRKEKVMIIFEYERVAGFEIKDLPNHLQTNYSPNLQVNKNVAHEI